MGVCAALYKSISSPPLFRHDQRELNQVQGSMNKKPADTTVIFVNRRKGSDRREDMDPCKDIPLDLYHRKRRKSKERRDIAKSLTDDYYSYMQKVLENIQRKATLEKPGGKSSL